MSPVSSELSSWRLTAYVLAALSLIVFMIQRFIFPFLDLIFEACIFHIPALVASIIYFREAYQEADRKGK